MPSEGLRARRRNEMGVRKGAELWLNGAHLKITHVWNGLFRHSEIKGFTVATEQMTQRPLA